MESQRVQSGKLMIKARTGKAHGHHDRRHDVAQRLVKICTVLFGHMPLPVLRDLCDDTRCQGIKIPDHRRQVHTARHSQRRPSVCRHTCRRKGQGRAQVVQIRLSTPDKGDRLQTVNNARAHPLLMQFSETDHNVALK